MSYTNNLSESELNTYKHIHNWNDFLQLNERLGILEYEINLDRYIIHSEVSFIGSKYNHQIIFKNCFFLKEVSITNSEFIRQVYFGNCYFDSSLNIGIQSIFNEKFFFNANNIKKDLQISYSKFNKEVFLNLRDCESISLINLRTKDCVVFLNKNIKKINFGQNSEGNFEFASLPVNNISEIAIWGLCEKYSLNLISLRVQKINFEDFTNSGVLRIQDLTPTEDSEFGILGSNLGQTEFSSIDFREFKHFNIYNSNIINTTFINCYLPEKISAYNKRSAVIDNTFNLIEKIEKRTYFNIGEKNQLETSKEVLDYYSMQREVYRQIKFALSKQGDIINEQKMHHLEMVAFDKSISFYNNFWTKMTIKFSHHFSNFGQSIDKPLIALLLGHTILFFFLVATNVLSPLQFSLDHPTAKGLSNGIYYYFKLINPVRPLDDKLFGNAYIIIDIIMRIWSSYMIYNIIRATRRFIK